MGAPAFRQPPQAREVLCQRCGHQWKYKGRNEYVVTCPYCCTKVTLKRSDERLHRQQRMLRQGEALPQQEDGAGDMGEAAACA